MKALAAVTLLLALASPALGRSLSQTAPALSLTVTAPPPAAGPTDVDILNFALQLEYLEAEFYSCAAFGRPLADDLRGGGPPSTGCQKAQLSGDAQAFATELADDEIAHVTLLRSALGSMAVPIPQLDIGPAFAAAADAATGMTLEPPFSPYLNELFFYHGAFIFEDVGVTAYEGAAPLISSPSYLGTAARILGTEAYHASLFRTLLFQDRNTVTPYNVTVATLVADIAALRAKLGGGSDEGVESSNGGAEIVPSNSMGLVYARTPTEVIDIVTAGMPSGGLFFPQGLTGFGGSSSS